MSTSLGFLLIFGAVPYFIFVVIMILGILKAKSLKRTDDQPSVAVIVAARNEAHNLPDLLNDLLAQDYKGEFNCIIADDRSTDDTWSIIHRFSKNYSNFSGVRIVEESSEMTGKKNALTQCIKNTTATILLETDADCRVGPGWITSMVSQFDEGTGIVVGFSSVRERGLFAIYQALDFMGIMMTNAGMMTHGKAWSGSGQNLGFRRSYFTSIGGFTSDPKQSIGDDFYLVQKISRIPGVRARFSWDPAGYVTTSPCTSVGEFFRQRKRWASDSRGLQGKDPLFFFFLVSAFLLNTAILGHILSLNFSAILIWILGLKFVIEFIVVYLGLKQLQRLADIWVFPVWFLVQPFYIPIMGISGSIGKVPWK